MFLFAESLVLGLISGILMCAGPDSDDSSAYLAGGDGPKRLKDTLVLREQQGGIAGVTGTIRTIEPNGKWRLEEFRKAGGKEQVKVTKTGQLSPAELEALDRLATRLAGDLGRDLTVVLSGAERRAVEDRLEWLLTQRVFPHPLTEYPYPWPMV